MIYDSIAPFIQKFKYSYSTEFRNWIPYPPWSWSPVAHYFTFQSITVSLCKQIVVATIRLNLFFAFINIVMATEASVLSLIRSNPIVVFVTSSCNATSCSYCRKAIEELTTKGHDHKVIVATEEEHAVSRLFR